MQLSIKEINKIIQGKISNPKYNAISIKGLAKIEEAEKGDLAFLANPKYTHYIYKTKASAVIVENNFKSERTISPELIYVKDPYIAFMKILEIFTKMKVEKKGISKKSEISKTSKINKNVYIGPFCTIEENVNIGNNVKILSNCYIGENVEIKENSILFSGVKIYHDCKIGCDNIIHSGTIIGSDGFGFAPNHKNNYEKIMQIGNVVLENNIEIGANTTIDRATMGATILREGVKLDNQIQIAHNVEVGKNTVIAAQVAIAGSTKIGKDCMIGGQTAIAGHLTIADNVKIAGQSGIASSITQKGEVVQGPMAFNIKEFQRSYVIFKKLPEMYKDLEKLKKK